MSKCTPALFLDQLRPGQILGELFDSIPDIFFFVKDKNSRFIAANETFARMLGAYSVDEILGKTDYDFSADFLANIFVEGDRQILRQETAILKTMELVPRGESLDWFVTTKVPLYSVSDDVIGLAGTIHMLTESDDAYRKCPELKNIVRYIQDHFRERISTADIANAAGISLSSIDRLFRRSFGISPFMYLRKTRLNAACRMLRKDGARLSDIAVECGFNDQASMTRAFRNELKITPMRYRNRYRDDTNLKA